MKKNKKKKAKNNIKQQNLKHIQDKDISVNENELNESVKKIEKQIENKKVLPKEVEEKLNKKVFENVLIANVIMVFLYFVSLGALNIETATFITDLKVFSFGLIIFTIILFETSYKKENGNLCIHGIECLILSIFILFSSYVYMLYIKDFSIYTSMIAYLFAIYYVGKSMIIYEKMKKQYVSGLSDIDEIIKK